jgi:hypothetical protein
MRKHNGMRPQDVAVLLKMIAITNKGIGQVQLMQLSGSMFISLSEVSESLNRSRIAGLIDYDKKRVSRQNLMEFLEHGIRYVFPQKPGILVRGIPTAHSHPFMRKSFSGEANYVWEDAKGKLIGEQIEPLYAKQTEAVKIDAVFYKLLALVDVVRVGKVREIKVGIAELKKIILNEQ